MSNLEQLQKSDKMCIDLVLYFIHCFERAGVASGAKVALQQREHVAAGAAERFSEA